MMVDPSLYRCSEAYTSAKAEYAEVMGRVCSASWLSLVSLLLPVLFRMPFSPGSTSILPRKPPDQKHYHEGVEPQDRQQLQHQILLIRPPGTEKSKRLRLTHLP